MIVIEHADHEAIKHTNRGQSLPHPVHLRGVGLQLIITGKALVQAHDLLVFALLWFASTMAPSLRRLRFEPVFMMQASKDRT